MLLHTHANLTQPRRPHPTQSTKLRKSRGHLSFGVLDRQLPRSPGEMCRSCGLAGQGDAAKYPPAAGRHRASGIGSASWRARRRGSRPVRVICRSGRVLVAPRLRDLGHLYPLQGVQASKISPRESRYTRHRSANRPNRAVSSPPPPAAAGNGTHPPAAENPKVEGHKRPRSQHGSPATPATTAQTGQTGPPAHPFAAAGTGTHPPAAENPKVECPLQGGLTSKIRDADLRSAR